MDTKPQKIEHDLPDVENKSSTKPPKINDDASLVREKEANVEKAVEKIPHE